MILYDVVRDSREIKRRAKLLPPYGPGWRNGETNDANRLEVWQSEGDEFYTLYRLFRPDQTLEARVMWADYGKE